VPRPKPASIDLLKWLRSSKLNGILSHEDIMKYMETMPDRIRACIAERGGGKRSLLNGWFNITYRLTHSFHISIYFPTGLTLYFYPFSYPLLCLLVLNAVGIDIDVLNARGKGNQPIIFLSLFLFFIYIYILKTV